MFPMHRPLFPFSLWLLSIIITISCTEVPMQTQPSPPDAGLDTINADNLAQHIQTLASDEFEGRLPGSKGEELTIEYLTDQFTQLGLSPGNPGGTSSGRVLFGGGIPSSVICHGDARTSRAGGFGRLC